MSTRIIISGITLLAVVVSTALVYAAPPLDNTSPYSRIGSKAEQVINKPTRFTPTRRPGAKQHSMGGGQNNFTAGCCQAPTPFPGKSCCDTRDCGWFACSGE